MTAGGVFYPCLRLVQVWGLFHQIETPSPTTIYSDEADKERYFPHCCCGMLSLQ